MAMNHYFEVKHNGAAGLLLAKGSLTDVSDIVSNLDNEKKGIAVEEITPEDAEKLKAQLEG